MLTGFGAGGNDGKSTPVAPPRPPATRDAGREDGGVWRGVAFDEPALVAEALHGVVVTRGVGCADEDGGRVGNADSFLDPLAALGVVVSVHVPFLLWLEREDCAVEDLSLRTREDLAGAIVTLGGIEAVTPAQPTLEFPVMPLGPGRDG